MRFRESLAFLRPHTPVKVSPLAPVSDPESVIQHPHQPWSKHPLHDDVSSEGTVSTSHGKQTPLIGAYTKGCFCSRICIVLLILFLVVLTLALVASIVWLGLLYSTADEDITTTTISTSPASSTNSPATSTTSRPSTSPSSTSPSTTPKTTTIKTTTTSSIITSMPDIITEQATTARKDELQTTVIEEHTTQSEVSTIMQEPSTETGSTISDVTSQKAETTETDPQSTLETTRSETTLKDTGKSTSIYTTIMNPEITTEEHTTIDQDTSQSGEIVSSSVGVVSSDAFPTLPESQSTFPPHISTNKIATEYTTNKLISDLPETTVDDMTTVERQTTVPLVFTTESTTSKDLNPSTPAMESTAQYVSTFPDIVTTSPIISEPTTSTIPESTTMQRRTTIPIDVTTEPTASTKLIYSTLERKSTSQDISTIPNIVTTQQIISDPPESTFEEISTTIKQTTAPLVFTTEVITSQKQSPSTIDIQSTEVITSQKQSPSTIDIQSTEVITSQKQSPSTIDIQSTEVITSQKPSPSTIDIQSTHPDISTIPDIVTTEHVTTEMQPTTLPETSTVQITTTESTTIIEETTEAIETTLVPLTTIGPSFPGNWTDWGEWGDCTVTGGNCGNGVQNRSRECLSTNPPCLGTDTQMDHCYIACDYPVYRPWGTWTGWTECPGDCGENFQFRQRFCDTSEAGLDCVGTGKEIKQCNGYQCSDNNCTEGTINEDGTQCECPGQTMSGTVFFEGFPIGAAGVTITDSTRPDKDITFTDSNGDYVINNVCTSITYVFTLDGYLPTERSGVAGNGIDIQLSVIQPLFVTQHPSVKYRVTEDNVTLCCDATSNIPPVYVEWYKNGQLVDPSRQQYPTIYTITDLGASDTGNYSCKLTNYYSDVTTDEALVTVKDLGTFCSPYPAPHTISLPVGCDFDELNELDVGKCLSGGCRGTELDAGTCEDSVTSCCGVTSYDVLNIECNGSIMSYDLITGCGCITNCTLV